MIFTKKFLDELQEKYKDIPDVLDHMIESGLNFHDSIVLLARRKGINVEYFEKGDKIG